MPDPDSGGHDHHVMLPVSARCRLVCKYALYSVSCCTNIFLVYYNRCRRNTILSIAEDDVKKLKNIRVSAITYLYDAVDINQVCSMNVLLKVSAPNGTYFYRLVADVPHPPYPYPWFFLPGWEH
jgi:hypothetical protein